MNDHPAEILPARVLHVGRPNLVGRDRFLGYVGQILDDLRFTNRGPLVDLFERRIAEHLGVAHCVVTSNATLALSLAAQAMGLTGSVIVPAFTFVASAHTMHGNGLRVIFADVDPDTHHIDVDRLEACLAPDTSAVLAVNLWGNPCRIRELEAFCAKHGLKLLFDSAQAFGSTYEGRRLGGFGDAEVFSFHATKAINSFEGGAITTNDAELAARLRLLINFGFSDEDCVDDWGTNAKMPEVCAAMGLSSLEGLETVFSHNRRIFGIYAELLEGLPGLTLQPYGAGEEAAHHYVVLRIDDALPVSRDALLARLRAARVMARRYFHPGCHRSEPYRSMPIYEGVSLPVTEDLCQRLLCLPTGLAIERPDVAAICAIITAAAQPGPDAPSANGV
ncbi:DegT/DnrJ/EryC1/StrS family aminotransferase [Frigidibacter sp. MR17.14]|uniref:DegT/DnrJ/EryC1/StrS family aminotransferase n=1 Tax=Frigidibacter sp. MR17.14 TaxID=3126509 RepID=UPI003012A5E7